MYRIAFIITLAFSLSLLIVEQAHGQRYLPEQKGVQFTAGTVDGFNPDKGFSFALALSSYNHSGNRWVIGADYMQKQYGYDSKDIPLAQFIAEGGYYKQILSDPSKTVFFSAGASLVAGYETINWGKKRLDDGATVTNKDNFLYGGAIAVEMETFLTDRLALLVNARERILFGSDISKFHTQVTVGVKVIIN